MTNTPIDTRTVTDRRTLTFTTTDELRREADRLTDAERAGTQRAAGNWSLGQAFGHLAAWIDYACDGAPAASLVRVPVGQRFGGRSVPMLGIAGVAVPPERRGGGLARRLMADAISASNTPWMSDRF